MRRLIALALALTVVACGSDDSTAPSNSSIAGTWSLQTINGSPLPFTLAPAPTKIEILSATAIINSNGTWTSSSQTRTTLGTQAPTTTTETDNGTYTISGSTIALRSSDGTVESGTISGNTFTQVESGFTFVFKKQ
jgi:hypothetical protein